MTLPMAIDYPHAILVLEDTHARVDWLAETFPSVEIVHATDVVQFLVHMRQDPHRWGLIILDHDLGGEGLAADVYEAGTAGDRYGLTGMDAARSCGHNTPVCVWSANPVWGPKMRHFLIERRVPVVYHPFSLTSDLRGTLREAYFHGTGVWLDSAKAV